VGTWHDPDLGRPIAAPLELCAELLGVDLATVRELAATVEPYIRADGTGSGASCSLSGSSGPRCTAGGEAATWTGGEPVQRTQNSWTTPTAAETPSRRAASPDRRGWRLAEESGGDSRLNVTHRPFTGHSQPGLITAALLLGDAAGGWPPFTGQLTAHSLGRRTGRRCRPRPR